MHMYGWIPTLTPFSQSTAFDTNSNPTHLRAKLAELKGFVDSNLTAATAQQKTNYDQHTSPPTFVLKT